MFCFLPHRVQESWMRSICGHCQTQKQTSQKLPDNDNKNKCQNTCQPGLGVCGASVSCQMVCQVCRHCPAYTETAIASQGYHCQEIAGLTDDSQRQLQTTSYRQSLPVVLNLFTVAKPLSAHKPGGRILTQLLQATNLMLRPDFDKAAVECLTCLCTLCACHMLC